jgi:hypothetical protein
MKRFLGAAITVGILAVGSVWLRAQRNDSRLLSTLLPSGAIFYLEAKDFHQLLTQWNSSEEKRRWLKSNNATVLSQSRLLQRLMQAQTQFATVARLPVQMSLVNELAGGQSAFAFYEFSTVHFVYVTRMDGARLDQSSLWKSRSSYQTRDVAGIPFYVKTETDGRDSYTVAFASHDGWLVVATEPTLMARTLALLAGQPAASVSAESWFEDTVKQIPEHGELRLVYNLTALRRSPQFRTYWIQRNNTELGEFTSGSADLFEKSDGFEERRVMLRATAVEAKTDTSGLTDVLAHVPQWATLYRAWASPSRAVVQSVLQQVIMSETAGAPDMNRNAPEVSTNAGTVGSESDLETRIDEPAFQRSSGNNIDVVTDAVMAMEPRALLHSQVTQLTADQVFVFPESEVALAFAKPDRNSLDKALQSSVSIVKTGSLDPLRVSEDKGVIVLSRLAAQPAVKGPSVTSGESYLAGYEHGAEWPRYKRLFGVLDHANANAPAFFGSNLRSLGDSLYRLRHVSVTTEEESAVTRETVDYQFLTK